MSADAILSTKRAILSSGGTKYNDLYYNIMNSSASLLECTFEYNQIISLPSMQFGSTSQINIPNDQFEDVMILHLVLPAIQANETICRGWGYSILQYISWTLGSSNSTQIMIQGDSIFQTVMGQIETAEKREEVLRLSGEQYLDATSGPIHAYCVIPLPYSALCDKLPFDTTMLQNNITIQIAFKSNTNCIYGGTATHPTSFTRSEVILRQGRLSDQSKSVRAAMVRDPMLKYAYPFIHNQNFVVNSFTGVLSSSGSYVQVDLNTFANADLVAIMFYVVLDSDKNPTSNNSPNPFNCADITNVQLYFAGQILFNLPESVYRLTNMLCGPGQGASFIPSSVINTGSGNPFTSTPKNCYPVFFDFSRLRSTCFQDHLFNTWRLTNQTLRLQFNTPTTNAYTLYATYFYNAVAEIQNGTSAIYID